MKELALKALLFVVALFAPIQEVLITVSILVLSDFVTGIWAAKIRGERISSAAMGRTISKIFVYEMVLAVLFLAETHLFLGVPLVKSLAAVIGIRESKSLLENANAILGIDIFKTIIAKIGSKSTK